ncbi:MAG TPA: TCR/Tet family MFS transporter [Candidatus Elarobacter sp.]
MSRAVAFLFATVFLDMLSFGIVAPVLPKLVLSFTGGDTARAAAIFGTFGTVFALMQFLCAPLLGALSDRFGRRPVIVLSNLGLGLDFVVMALAPTLGWLFAGRVLAGITSANLTTANAYVADVASPDERAGAFGVLGAAFGLGFIAGPAIGGLLGSVHARLPFWSAAALGVINAGYGLCVLPESLPRERRMPLALRRINPFGALALLCSRNGLLALSTIAFVSILAGTVLQSIYVLDVSRRFGWDDRIVGLSLAAVGICSALVQVALMKPAIKRLGERGTMVCGLAGGAAGMAIFAIAPSGPTFALGIPLMALWGLAPAAAQATMTRHVGPSEQGALQGAITSLGALAAIGGPLLFAMIYARSLGPAPWNVAGAGWLLATAMLAAAACLAARMPEPRTV